MRRLCEHATQVKYLGKMGSGLLISILAGIAASVPLSAEPGQVPVAGTVVSAASRWVQRDCDRKAECDEIIVTEVTARFAGRTETRTFLGGELNVPGVGTVRQYALSAPIYRAGQLVDENFGLLNVEQEEYSAEATSRARAAGRGQAPPLRGQAESSDETTPQANASGDGQAPLRREQAEYGVAGTPWAASKIPVKVFVFRKLFPGVKKADLKAAAEQVRDEWNAVGQTPFQFTAKLGNKKLNPADGKCRIIPVAGALGPNQVLERIVTEVNGELTDIDVLVNADKTYVMDMSAASGQGAVYDIRTVLRQAFGLIANLGFSSQANAVMYSPLPANTEKQITNDDKNALRGLYPEVVLGSLTIDTAHITPTTNPIPRGRLLNIPGTWSSVVEGQLVICCSLIDAATGNQVGGGGLCPYVFGPAENQPFQCSTTVSRELTTVTATSRVTASLKIPFVAVIATTSASYHKDWVSP